MRAPDNVFKATGRRIDPDAGRIFQPFPHTLQHRFDSEQSHLHIILFINRKSVPFPPSFFPQIREDMNTGRSSCILTEQIRRLPDSCFAVTLAAMAKTVFRRSGKFIKPEMNIFVSLAKYPEGLGLGARCLLSFYSFPAPTFSSIEGSFLINASPRRTAMETPAEPSPVAAPASFPE